MLKFVIGWLLILLKFVISFILIYFLSFFKALAGIIYSLEYLFNVFLWGGAEEKRKIIWLEWDTVCLSKKNCGLGVRKLREFNEALLGKWC